MAIKNRGAGASSEVGVGGGGCTGARRVSAGGVTYLGGGGG